MRLPGTDKEQPIETCSICGTPLWSYQRQVLSAQEKEPVTIRTFAVYRQNASKTDADLPLEYYALGLAGEAGECVDAIKKHLYHDRPDSLEKAIEEIGDLLWFTDRLSAKLGVSLEEIASRNARKCASRYPAGWDIEIARAKR